jgi:multidrug efflux pump subunit AcrB
VEESIDKKGLLGWFASNHVAANLLMWLIISAGLLTIMTINNEVFPELSIDQIIVTVPYLGASPAEVEQGVCLRVEEAVSGLDGVKRIRSLASEGAGVITVEVDEYADTGEVLDDVKVAIDRIITFPKETEKPIISEIKTRQQVLTLMIYGDTSERTLKELAQKIRDDLTSLEGISQAEVSGVRPYEISIEVSEKMLRKLGLSFDQVSNAVARSSLDIPGGSVKTAGGEILFRAKGQRYLGSEFEEIVVLTRTDGTQVRLGNIAEVVDSFKDTELVSRFDGRLASGVKVYRVGDQGAIGIAEIVNEYLAEARSILPEGVDIEVWQDNTEILKSRMDLLIRNARIGLVLVFLCLTLFLDIRLAFWTTLGIPISFLGAFWLMPMFDLTINMISLFAFIMSLGLVVDDAIVVGENIFEYRQRGMNGMDAAIKGVQEMAAPVTLAVLTTAFAFFPLLFIESLMGKFLRVIPIVVISVLAVSLVEALLILPSHLSRSRAGKNNNEKARGLSRLHGFMGRLLELFVKGPFTRFICFAVRWRYATLSCAVAVLMITIGFIAGGYIKFTFFDPVEADNMVALLTMPQGTPIEQTEEIVERIEKAADQVRSEFDVGRSDGKSIFRHVLTTIGSQPLVGERGPESVQSTSSSSAHLAEINVELLGGEDRVVSSIKLKNRWRDLVGEVAGVSSLTFESEIFSPGEDINFELSHEDFDKLLAASEDMKIMLTDYAGVSDITDSFEPGKAELKLALKPSGRMLGLTLSDLARQVRQGFYGDEVQRIQRGQHDVRVMVRYPKEERRSIADIENMRIRLSGGTEIPFNVVAEVEHGRGYANIRRMDRKRVVNVMADVDESKANASEINVDIIENKFPELRRKYPGLNYRLAGVEQARAESFSSLRRNYPLALLAIFGLLAVQFRSYTQPLIVMSAIPFGLVGATIGHVVMGYNLGFLSLLGIAALSGVVVNDSLIMIDLINRERKSGISLSQVLRDCATRRFRPIILTTLTTFFGLVPMMMERSLQARFLIPMAISLAFGVMFATSITLVLVPSLYMILEDLKSILTRKK